METAQAQFGANVRKARLALAVSQEELADRADLHRTYIGQVERGETNISLANIVRLARALQVEVSKLMRGI